MIRKIIFSSLMVGAIGLAGCAVGSSVVQKTAPDGTVFYFPKSGKSKGGGPVMTGVVVRDGKEGEIVGSASGYAAGLSTTDRILSGVLGAGTSLGSALGSAAILSNGMGNIKPSVFNDSSVMSQTQLQQQVQAQ